MCQLEQCTLIEQSDIFNQECAGQRPAYTWFLEIAFVQEVGLCVCVCVCVCVCPRLQAIKNHSREMKPA